MHVPQTTCYCGIDIGADVALSAVINIQSLKLHLNFGSLFKCMTFVPDIPFNISIAIAQPNHVHTIL